MTIIVLVFLCLGEFSSFYVCVSAMLLESATIFLPKYYSWHAKGVCGVRLSRHWIVLKILVEGEMIIKKYLKNWNLFWVGVEGGKKNRKMYLIIFIFPLNTPSIVSIHTLLRSSFQKLSLNALNTPPMIMIKIAFKIKKWNNCQNNIGWWSGYYVENQKHHFCQSDIITGWVASILEIDLPNNLPKPLGGLGNC